MIRIDILTSQPHTCTVLESQTKELGHETSSPLPPLSMLIIRCFFPFFVRKNAIFSNIDYGVRGIRDTAQVSQLLLAGIVVKLFPSLSQCQRLPRCVKKMSKKMSNVIKIISSQIMVRRSSILRTH